MGTDNIEFNTAFWLKHYKELKKEFWTVLSVLSVIIFVICMIIICSGGEAENHFEQAIREYEQMTGRKIYPTGREFLRKAAEQKGLNTKSEIMDLIKYNEKFMWK